MEETKVCDEKKAFDPDVTRWLGWAYLIATMALHPKRLAGLRFL